MRTALLLIDLQYDFIQRSGLNPDFNDIAIPIGKVLSRARSSGMPVAHIRTRVDVSGSNRMPHWQQSGTWECVAGTKGEQAPAEFTERSKEPVFHKQFFSGFSNSSLDDWLLDEEIEALWIAGLYTHGCIRATVMDAYERGYRVTVIDDGIASNDALHARISREYMNGRAARFESSENVLDECVAEYLHFNPDNPAQEVARVRPSKVSEIKSAVITARNTQESWSGQSLEFRRSIFRKFALRLQSGEQQLVDWMIQHLGKPRKDATDEMHRAHGHLAAALQLDCQEPFGEKATVSYLPHGAVAVVTPWNNPVAIPVGKISAAVLLGNSVVWKPAFQADTISRNLVYLLLESGLPEGLVQLVNGGPAQVAELAGQDDISAVTLTGSEQAGRAVSAVCRLSGKPLQAELGGNNAMLVLSDADVPGMVAAWAQMAFGFAGQRCTAIRRFVVERSILDQFTALFCAHVRQMKLSGPSDTECDVGPLISSAQFQRVKTSVHSAVQRGGVILTDPTDLPASGGHYFPPTLLSGLEPSDPMVQEELFGPVAVVQLTEDSSQGLDLVNGVRQGLVAGIATSSAAKERSFTERVQAGIVIDGHGMKIHPAAPFGGLKASQIGPPEHGAWDREFFTRVQIRYRSSPA